MKRHPIQGRQPGLFGERGSRVSFEQLREVLKDAETPRAIAERLGVSRSWVYWYLKTLEPAELDHLINHAAKHVAACGRRLLALAGSADAAELTRLAAIPKPWILHYRQRTTTK